MGTSVVAALCLFVFRDDPIKPLPAIDLPDTNGHMVDVRDFRGQVVVIAFFRLDGWGTEGRHMSFLQRLWSARRDQGFSVVGVTNAFSRRLEAEDERRGGAMSAAHAAALSELIEYHHLTFPVVEDVDFAVHVAYGRGDPHRPPPPRAPGEGLYANPQHCLPSTYVFDRRGRQRDQRCGFTQEDASILGREIQALLAE